MTEPRKGKSRLLARNAQVGRPLGDGNNKAFLLTPCPCRN
jgi:hypothetical protein